MEIFSVIDPWGDKVVLTEEDWRRIVPKHPEIEPYVREVEETLVRPQVVYEGRYRFTSKVFYARGLIHEAPYGGCWVAVIARYTEEPATISTAYLPFQIEGRLGNLLHLAR